MRIFNYEDFVMLNICELYPELQGTKTLVHLF